MPDEPRDELLKRLDSLERQSEELRREVRRLRADLAGREASVVEDRSSTEARGPASSERTETPGRAAPIAPGARRGVDLEFWLGGRGLLLIGVVALVVAVGFFVEYTIEQGWLGPPVRVLLGAALGAAAVALGERVRGRGYRTYGLWVAAGGFSAIYISIWAAAALYGLVGTAVALALMVTVVSAAAILGWRRASESFVALAAFGGYLAPLLLELEPASTAFGLAYLAVLSGAALWLGAAAGWPGLAALAVAGGMLMTLPGPGGAGYVIYLIVLVGLAELIGRRRRWSALSAEAIVLGWFVLWVGSGDWGVSGLGFSLSALGLWLASLVGYVGVRDWTAGDARPGVADRPGDVGSASRRAGLAEMAGLAVTIVPPWAFYASAMMGVAESAWRAREDLLGLGLGLVLGAVYLWEATTGPEGRGTAHRSWRLGLAFALWLMAPVTAWSGLALTDVWLVEGLIFTAVGVLAGWREPRAAGLAAIVLSLLAYYSISSGRPLEDAAFLSAWGLTGLAVAAAPAAWAMGLEWVRGQAAWESAIRPLLLLLGAVLFLAWGTAEILRFYGLLSEPQGWVLARDLSISGFWLAYAAALLAVGFRLDRPPVRWAGLSMALVTAAKVFLYDLSNLSELYRILSFLLLAAVLLALSFRYQRLRPGLEE